MACFVAVCNFIASLLRRIKGNVIIVSSFSLEITIDCFVPFVEYYHYIIIFGWTGVLAWQALVEGAWGPRKRLLRLGKILLTFNLGNKIRLQQLKKSLSSLSLSFDLDPVSS